MSLNESIVEDAALEWFLLRQGFRLHQGFGGQDGGQVGDPPSPPPPPRLWRSGRIRWTGLSYAVGHGAAFAKLRQAKPSLAPGEYAGGPLTPALSQGERELYGEVVQTRCARTLIPAFSQGEKEVREAIRRLSLPILTRALDTLRDPAGAGLPKLLSGELSVAELQN